MGYKRKAFNELGFEKAIYQRYFHNHQQEYIRLRLRCVNDYADGMEFKDIAQQRNIHEQTCRSYINMYIAGGFKHLCTPTKREQPTRLTVEQEESFKEVLLTKRPEETGLEGNIWTGDLMCRYLKKAYGVVYKSGIYDLLERLNLTYQRAHSDYGNADSDQQIAYWTELENCLLTADDDTAVIKFDEFSVCERPSTYYGWAEKNTRPTYRTNEKKEQPPTDY